MARIAALDPGERTLFELCTLERVSRDEAAARVGLSSAAVTKRWQRLRARLAAENAPSDLLS